MSEDATTQETEDELSFEEICEIAQRDRLTLAMTLTVLYGFQYEDALVVSDAAALASGNIDWFRGLVGATALHIYRPLPDDTDSETQTDA